MRGLLMNMRCRLLGDIPVSGRYPSLGNFGTDSRSERKRDGRFRNTGGGSGGGCQAKRKQRNSAGSSEAEGAGSEPEAGGSIAEDAGSEAEGPAHVPRWEIG